MRRFTLAEILAASVLVASTTSAVTCIIPSELSRANAEWFNERTPEAKEALQREIDRGAFREHVVLAAQLTALSAIALAGFNLVLPSRRADPAD